MKAFTALFLLLASVICSSAQTSRPKVFLMDADRLTSIKKKYQQKDPATVQLVNDLQKEADKLLDMKPVSVMDKTISPPSGNKHDYMSQAPYFWYDSTKPNGLPYIRRDGQRNPEIYKITDRTYLGNLDNASRVLSLTWWITGEENMRRKPLRFSNTGSLMKKANESTS
jgi:hypothetical protein